MEPWLLAIGLLTGGSAQAGEQAPDYPLQAVPLTDVRLADEFWRPRLETCRTVTIPHCLRMCAETGRLDNFAVAGGLKPGRFRGLYFNDSDVFKVIEGAAHVLATQPDPQLDARLDELIATIAAAQEPDGYLYTARTLRGPDYMPPGGPERWSDLAHGHELYNVGHLYEAAAAHFLATGKRSLLDVAVRNADLVCREFGPGRRTAPCGHPEIELALVRLFRVTGEPRYLDLARFFIEARGRADGRALYGEYAQDHAPLLAQAAAVGHAVRAAYLYCGAADVAALTGAPGYPDVLQRLWENVVGCKLYLTGGIGARGGGETFGEDYELPNRTAYAETCAAIANVLWNQRLFLLTGDARYIDVLERALYNNVLAGVSLSGDRFFYANPLEAGPDGAERVPWFECACCPPNIARILPQVPGLIYARRDDALYVNLFAAGTASVALDRTRVQLAQATRYPWDGTVRITVTPEPAPATFALLVRIPGWARGQPVPGDLYRYGDASPARPTLQLNGQLLALTPERGFARIERAWRAGDTLELHLPMPVRRVVAHERVRENAGRVALERGPLVYCAEGADNPDGRVLSVLLPDGAPLRAEPRPDLLGGLVAIHARARAVQRAPDGTPAAGPEQDLLAIPYYAWAHRGRGEMAVWLARDPAAAALPPNEHAPATTPATAPAAPPPAAASGPDAPARPGRERS